LRHYQFVSDVAANIETRIRRADIAFHCDFASDSGTFEVDPGLLRSALSNILENAMEACIEDEKTASHCIDFKVSADTGGVMFEIADNGAGMAEAQMKSLFYSSKGRKGTRLGLFITHKVIWKHGGSISVDSRPYGGAACFSIRLPRKLSGIPR
jgi:signal transduction histidine kinase